MRNGAQVYSGLGLGGNANSNHGRHHHQQSSSNRGAGGGMMGTHHHHNGVLPGHVNSVPSMHMNGANGGIGTTSYSNISSAGVLSAQGQSAPSSLIANSTSLYQQNANTVASINAEMPMDPVFFLSDGTAIPAHEADYEVSAEYDPQGAAAAHFMNEYFSRMGEGEMGPNAAGETGLPDPFLVPNDPVIAAELNEALAAFDNANNAEPMNGAGDIIGASAVYTLNEEEEQAFAEFLQATSQPSNQQVLPSTSTHQAPQGAQR